MKLRLTNDLIIIGELGSYTTVSNSVMKANMLDIIYIEIINMFMYLPRKCCLCCFCLFKKVSILIALLCSPVNYTYKSKAINNLNIVLPREKF